MRRTSHHPSCNSFHEFDLGDFWLPLEGEEQEENDDFDDENVRLVNGGAYRDVWMVREYDGSKRALKTLRFVPKRQFDLRNFDRHRRDALAFEQLTASSLVVDIYGHCANSALFDFAGGGGLFQVFESNPSKVELLNISYGLARSVADAHNTDQNGRPSIAHRDIKPDQWIRVNGEYKLNDFNRARFLTWDKTRNEVCPFGVGKNAGIWRSPEEYNYGYETEKVDVWSLGNVLYFMLTGNEPYHEWHVDHVMKHVQSGGRPVVTEKSILASPHPFDVALLKALDLCFIPDPSERASATEVANLLMSYVHIASTGADYA